MPRPSLSLFIDRQKRNFSDARQIIKNAVVSNSSPQGEIDLTSQINLSSQMLGDYVNLDWEHRSDILDLVRRIRSYANDKSRRRPLNIIMHAEPGSGKSHFIKCLAGSSRFESRVAAVTFNMAGMRGLDDLIQPLDAVRNLKVLDKTPILFLDEFDSNPFNYPLLLPLLWDGEIHVGHRDLKTGKVIIILAASGKSINEAIKNARNMQNATAVEGPKIVDLLSRINGGEFSIPELDLVTENRDRRTDKVCIAISLLKQRYGETLQTAPWAFLHFVAHTKFRYGVRSLTHLIDLLPTLEPDSSILKLNTLPLADVDRLKHSSLSYHLISEDGPTAVVDTWKNAAAFDATVRFSKPPDDPPF